MKNLILILLFMVSTFTIKSQNILVELSGGYTVGSSVPLSFPADDGKTFVTRVAKMSTPSLIMKFGYVSDDNVGLYLKWQGNVTRNSDAVQIVGLHICKEFNGFRPNIGLDYHMGSTDYSNPLTGMRFSYGVQKCWENNPWVISAEMSGRYLTVSVGMFASL